MNNIGVTIKIQSTLSQLLADQNLSIRELSKRSGVPNSTLQEWSSNRSPKNPVQVQKVASCLGVSMHYLLFGEEDGSEPLAKLMKEDFFSGTFEINIKKLKVK